MSAGAMASLAAEALTNAADVIRDSQAVYDAVDVYFRDRELDVDAEDVARAMLEAASGLRRATS